jgi:uncharacterized protein YkwD
MLFSLLPLLALTATLTSAAPVPAANGAALQNRQQDTTVAIIPATISAEQQVQYLSEHNDFRANYAAEPLVWSDNLASAAQTWADRCHWGHSKGAMGNFGESTLSTFHLSFMLRERVRR